MNNIGQYIENFIIKNNNAKQLFDIKIGKSINENCFKLNIDRVQFYSIIKEIKKKLLTDNIKYNNYHRYTHANLQLDCFSNGIQKCIFKKPKDILDISIDKRNYDLRIISNKLTNLPSHIFPCNNYYHSIANIESITIDNKLYKIIFNHIKQDKSETYQITIQFMNISNKNIKLACNDIVKLLELIL
jgi:hypothetical protein